MLGLLTHAQLVFWFLFRWSHAQFVDFLPFSMKPREICFLVPVSMGPDELGMPTLRKTGFIFLIIGLALAVIILVTRLACKMSLDFWLAHLSGRICICL